MSGDLKTDIQKWENELKSATPRKVRLRSLSQTLYTWIYMTLMAAAGLLLLLLAVVLGLRHFAGEFGTATSGFITQAYTDTNSNGAETYFVQVEFLDTKGEKQTANPEVSQLFCKSAKPGQTASLHYFTWFPALVFVDGGTESGWMFMAIVACLGLCIFLTPVLWLWKERNLLIWGQPMKGEITGVYHYKVMTTYGVRYMANNLTLQKTFIAIGTRRVFQDYSPVLVAANPLRPKKACLYSDLSLWQVVANPKQ